VLTNAITPEAGSTRIINIFFQTSKLIYLRLTFLLFIFNFEIDDSKVFTNTALFLKSAESYLAAFSVTPEPHVSLRMALGLPRMV